MSREPMAADRLIRFVRAPDGQVVADLRRKLPGRGIWVEARRDKVAQAVARKVFRRGFKDHVEVPDALPDEVDRLLEAAVLDMLKMANKAGRVVTGFGKAEAAIGKGEAVALLHASDGAEDGKRKLAQAARRETGGRGLPALGEFSSGQMDLALGRENVIHAALLADPVSDAFLARASALMRYRHGDDTGQGSDAEQAAETDQE